MKRVRLLMWLGLVAGCGSDAQPLFGGFVAQNGAAVALAPATCDIPFVGTTSVAGILVELTSAASACDILTAAAQCGTKASATTVLLAAVNGEVGGTVGATGPGTYRFLAEPPGGAFLAATGAAADVDASCANLGDSPLSMTGGSITIATVTSLSVTGTIDAGFENGQVLQQPFDVTICPVSIDVCSLFLPCANHMCVP